METRSNVPSEHATPGEMQKQTPGKSPPPRALGKQLYSHGPKLEIIRMSPTG